MKLPGEISSSPLSSRRSRWACGAVLALVFCLATPSLFAADAADAYANWIKPWTEQATNSPVLGGAGLKLLVSCVQGETNAAAAAAMSPVDRLALAYHLQVLATEVATNGEFRSYAVSNTNPQTSAVRQLSPSDFTMLNLLVNRLPSDNGQLPPPGKRVVMQSLADGQWRVRVYDGNHLAPEVEDVLNLLAKPYDKLF